jgi:hypothetical protein
VRQEEDEVKLAFKAGRCNPGERSRNTRGVQLSLKYSPTRLPTNYPTTGTWNNGAPIG